MEDEIRGSEKAEKLDDCALAVQSRPATGRGLLEGTFAAANLSKDRD
jgi:hypothetical protein